MYLENSFKMKPSKIVVTASAVLLIVVFVSGGCSRSTERLEKTRSVATEAMPLPPMPLPPPQLEQITPEETDAIRTFISLPAAKQLELTIATKDDLQRFDVAMPGLIRELLRYAYQREYEKQRQSREKFAIVKEGNNRPIDESVFDPIVTNSSASSDQDPGKINEADLAVLSELIDKLSAEQLEKIRSRVMKK
jgi:hypothetical protein